MLSGSTHLKAPIIAFQPKGDVKPEHRAIVREAAQACASQLDFWQYASKTST
ncbi:MAG: hypothetical protein RBJ76_28495 [Stenomitos frigidus ULC029]